jgi:hypothetical protein
MFWRSSIEYALPKFSFQNCSRIGPARRPILLLEPASIIAPFAAGQLAVFQGASDDHI